MKFNLLSYSNEGDIVLNQYVLGKLEKDGISRNISIKKMVIYSLSKSMTMLQKFFSSIL